MELGTALRIMIKFGKKGAILQRLKLFIIL